MPSRDSRRGIWHHLPRAGQRERIGVYVASASSTFGNSVHIIAAALLALKLSGSAASVPVIALVGTVPPLLLVNVVRRAVAHASVRRVLVVIDLVSCVFAASLPVIAVFSRLDLWEVYVQELLLGCSSSFYSPSSRAWSSDISHSEADLVLTNSLLGGVTQGANVVGWGVGGLLSATLGPLGAISVNSASFLLSAAIQLWVFSQGFAVRIADNAGIDRSAPVRIADLGRLVRTTFGGSRAGALARSLIAIGIAQRLQFSLFVVFLTLAVHVSESALGVANALFSAGAALGASLVAGGVTGWWARRRPELPVAMMFATLLVFGLSMSPWMAVPIYGLVGVMSASVTPVQCLLQDARRSSSGETFATLGAAQALANMAALGALSLVLLHLSVRATYLGAMALCGSLTVLCLLSGRPTQGSLDHAEVIYDRMAIE
jgi:hypothetical protein